MVNFRFHLVSLTAVFLALAAGIAIGAGVVDRATVDQIERQLSDVAKRREETNAENDRLRADLSRWGDFSKDAGDRLVAGQLTGVPIVLVSTSGVDRGLVESVAGALTAAGAEVDGTFWFTGRWKLGSEDEARALAGVLDTAPTTDAEELRSAAVNATATAWAVGDSGPLVTALLDSGFLEFDPPATELVPLAELPRPSTLFLVVSDESADVPVADLAVPLVTRLVGSQVPVLAAQRTAPVPAAPEGDAGKDHEAEKPPPAFVDALRADGSIASRVSTVDNLEDYRGRVATVLALHELRTGKTGHYGFGADTKLVPEAPPA
jgi:hypothetical protein